MSGRTFPCAQCKEPIWLEDETYAVLKRSARSFVCIWGHSNVFTPDESEANKLRRERDLLQQRLAEKDDDIKRNREWAESAERRASAAKGQITRGSDAQERPPQL